MRGTTLSRRLLLAGLATAAVLTSGVATWQTTAAHADDVSASAKPTAAIALGDSFSSGEGGRWRGNKVGGSGDRGGTDMAAYQDSGGRWRYDPANRAYDPESYDNHCHRSRWAPITSASLPGIDHQINLACSGAETKHIWRLIEGGENFKGEMPQASQLALLRDQYDIKLITLGIGGNDIGFGELVPKCVKAWLYHNYKLPFTVGSHCSDDAREEHEVKLNKMRSGVMKSIDEIRSIMRLGGYADGDYRLVLVTYPNPLPRGSEFRYSESDRLANKCGFRGSDADYVDDTLLPRLNGMLESAAVYKGVDYLDLSAAFDGHQLCHEDTLRPASSTSPPVSPRVSEWVRFIDAKPTFDWASWSTVFVTQTGDQGRLQESFHPNRHGQEAIGACVSQVFAAEQGNYSCHNKYAWRGNPSMYLEPRTNLTYQGVVGSLRGGGTYTLPDYTTRKASVSVPSNSATGPARLVQVELDIEHERHNQLEITMVRPDGKRVPLLTKGQAAPTGGRKVYKFVRGASESIQKGTWKFEVRDTSAGWTGKWYSYVTLTLF